MFYDKYKELCAKKGLSPFAAARDLGADIIIVRCIENCSHKDFDAAAFKASLGDLISYLDKTGKAKLIVTTSFWSHPGDAALADFAAEREAAGITSDKVSPILLPRYTHGNPRFEAK